MRTPSVFAFLLLVFAFGATTARAEAIDFNVPAQSGDRSLLAFAKQARIDLLYSFDDLRKVQTNAVIGRYEPQQALEILLRGTGYVARQTGEGKWVVTPTGPPGGTIKGKILAPDGSPARRVRVTILPSARSATTTDTGEFEIAGVPPAEYALFVTASGAHPMQISHVMVTDQQVAQVGTHALQRSEDPTRLEPYVVEGQSPHGGTLDHSDAAFAPRTAGGNLDLTRTESDALPYMIFNRSQIARSGVVNLNEFLQRELIDSSADALPPDQDPTASKIYTAGSTNLRLRGYSADETVILVNGRRLPEVVTSMGAETLPPDVNFIPLSLVQQVEVLPVSASSLYSGNAVGGVINIVLRPDVDTNTSEVTATYTNAFGHFDAPQSSLSLIHAQSLLRGALRVRLNASFARATPPTEAELGFRQKRFREDKNLDISIYRATPNVHSTRPQLIALDPKLFTGDNAATEPPSYPKTEPPQQPLPPLFGPGTSPVTSVAPGSDGTGGLAAFRGREGVRNFAYFDSPGPFSTSIDSLDFPYGRQQKRSTYYGSAVYDVVPWLQVAIDGLYSFTTVNRGYDVFATDLTLKAANPLNPFHQDAVVSLNEIAPKLGDRYTQANLEYGSVVFGAIVKLPRDWHITLDAQYSNNLVKYRSLAGASIDRWQKLVNAGIYNPLRDTQLYGPPQAFYDEVLVYRGGVGRFVTLGNYEALDLALRTTNEKLKLPTGTGVVNVGADYRRNHLAKYTEQLRFADGTPAADPQFWSARSLGRYSFFGELQGPLYPVKRLPRWIQQADGDLALRYVASSSTHESNFAPTYGVKIALPGGFAFRGSLTTSSRFPTPTMSRQIFGPSTDNGIASPTRELITDYIRHEKYGASVDDVMNPDLRPEAAVTQTAGVIFQRGQDRRLRLALDFVDTQKINELVALDKDTITANEAIWPGRVIRAAPGRGEAPGTGLIQSVLTGRANLAKRRSQDWTTSADYRQTDVLGGTLEAYARVLYFQRYEVQALPNLPMIDELKSPNGVVSILRYRSNFGAAWSDKLRSFGVDGHYFHSRLLPQREWEAQGRRDIRPFWQFDAFMQEDLGQWLPWHSSRFGLRAQLRVNNLFATPFPKYVNDLYGSGVQPYGDWRGRVYSLSVTATF